VPEGDTIHRAADRLRPALEGAVLERFEAPTAPRPHPRPGERIEVVEARGKHLLVHFERGLVLDTHLGMAGTWRLYHEGEPWRRPRHLARAVVAVEGWTAVCFAAPSVRVTTRPAVDHLGPDLAVDDVDLDACVRRARTLPSTTELADVLLDQRVAAGIGNVYKSEACFACRLHPLTPVGALSDDRLRVVFERASRQLRANLTGGARTTVGGRPGELAVYGRGRRPCRRCGTPIVSRRTGVHRRGTYWCPRCQPLQDAPDG
jgi:endonuclease-8